MALQREDAEKAILARQFIESQGPSFHQAFGMKSHFNITTSTYELQEVYELRETLRSVKHQVPELVDFDPESCTWQDVLEQLARAQDAALQSEKQGEKWHHKMWRGVGSYGSVVSPALSAFPDELSVLHGGLAVVLSIARHREQNRVKVLRAFENIPNVIQMAQDKTKSFPLNYNQGESIRLHESIGEFQRTLLCTLPNLIEKLNPDTFLRKATSAFKGHHIDHLLDEIFSSSDKVRTCAESMRDVTMIDTHRVVLDHFRLTENLSATANKTHATGVKTEEGMERMSRELTEIKEYLQQQHHGQYSVDAQNGALQFIMEFTKSEHFQERWRRSPDRWGASGLPPEASARWMFTPSELLALIDVHHLEALQEESYIIRHGYSSLDSVAISRAASMLPTAQVQQLLHSGEPGLVLVDGCVERGQMTTQLSPLSYVCAMLAHALRQRSEDSLVLVFFCGQHADANDDLHGPLGLMRSLLSQLVRLLVYKKWMSDVAPVWMDRFMSTSDLDLMEQDDENPCLADLCGLFHRLLGVAPEGTPVYCLVDGVSHFDREALREDYDIVVGSLGNIVSDQRLGACFKVLMTSPTVVGRFPLEKPHERLSLRGVRTGGAAFDRAFRAAIRTRGV